MEKSMAEVSSSGIMEQIMKELSNRTKYLEKERSNMKTILMKVNFWMENSMEKDNGLATKNHTQVVSMMEKKKEMVLLPLLMEIF